MPSESFCRRRWWCASPRRRCSCRAWSSGTRGKRAWALTTSSRGRSGRGVSASAPPPTNGRPFSGAWEAGARPCRPSSGCRTPPGSAMPSPGAWSTSHTASCLASHRIDRTPSSQLGAVWPVSAGGRRMIAVMQRW